MAREVTVSYRNSDSRLWDSVDVSLLESDLISAGIADYSGDGSDCQVTESDTPDTNVVVKVGRVYVTGVDDGQEDSHTERIFIRTARTLAIAANAGGTNRVDAVIARIDVDAVPDAEADNVGTIVVISGSGATALSDGAIQSAIGDDAFYRLANVTAQPSFTTIETDDIEDTREPFSVNISSLKSVINGELGYIVATGSSNNFNVTLPIPLLEIPDGLAFTFQSNQTVSGGVTVTITDSRGNAFSPIALKKEGNSSAIATSEIADEMLVQVQFDGTEFQMMNPVIPPTPETVNEYGTAADGNATISSPTTLSGNMNYDTLTVETGQTLTTAGYLIKARTIDLQGTGKIIWTGNAAGAGANGDTPGGTTPSAGGTAGAALTGGGSLPGGLAGQAGGVGDPNSGGSNGAAGTAGAAESAGIGGAGSAGGAGGDGTVTGSTTGYAGGAAGAFTQAKIATILGWSARIPLMGTDNIRSFSGFAGSGSGGGGGCGGVNGGDGLVNGGGGGGSGGNGGNIDISAQVVLGSGTVESKGGAGGNGGNGQTGGSGSGNGGGGGGGGGGQGGIINFVYSDKSASTVALVVTGGAAGSGGTSSGNAGSAGTAGKDGVANWIHRPA